MLRYNPGANLSADGAAFIANQTRSDTSYTSRFPANIVEGSFSADTSAQALGQGILANEIYSTFSQDPFIRTYLGSLSRNLQNETSLQMIQIQAPSRKTGLLFTINYPLIPAAQWEDYDALYRFNVEQAALLRNEINGLEFNQYPWWLDLRGVMIPAAEQLN